MLFNNIQPEIYRRGVECKSQNFFKFWEQFIGLSGISVWCVWTDIQSKEFKQNQRNTRISNFLVDWFFHQRYILIKESVIQWICTQLLFLVQTRWFSQNISKIARIESPYLLAATWFIYHQVLHVNNNKSNIYYKTNSHMLLFSFLWFVQSKADTASLNTSCFAPKWKCFVLLETSKKATIFQFVSINPCDSVSYELSPSTAIWVDHPLRLLSVEAYQLKHSSVEA